MAFCPTFEHWNIPIPNAAIPSLCKAIPQTYFYPSRLSQHFASACREALPVPEVDQISQNMSGRWAGRQVLYHTEC